MNILKVKANPSGISPTPNGRFIGKDMHREYRYEPISWSLGLLVDKIPTRDDLYWQAYPASDRTVLVGLHPSGLARVLQHMPGNQRGFGGNELFFTFPDGVTRGFVGPWDSCATGATGTGAPHLVDVAITDDSDWFDASIAVTHQMVLTVARALLAEIPDFEFVPDADVFQLRERVPAAGITN